jgi:hypothetical protein
MNPHDEHRLRDLLDDAVSDVEPRHGLDAITSRTKVTSMSNRPWLYGVGGAVLATAATIAAFAVLDGDSGTTTSPDPVDSPTAVSTEKPEKSPTPDDSPTAEPAPTETTVPVYYVGETGQGPRLYREFHQALGADEDASAAQAVQDALGVPPDDPDYATLWPSGSEVQHVELSGDTIVVDLMDADALHDRPAGMTEREAQLALEQLIYTVQGVYQDRAPVRFLLDGQITDTVLGVPTSEPLAEGDEASTLAQVWIIDPTDGATVDSGFEVSGVGAFFEANVTWELRQGAKVVKSGFTTAEECCRMAPYSFTVDAPAGDYLLVVKDSDMSEGEGFAPFQDTKRVTVR